MRKNRFVIAVLGTVLLVGCSFNTTLVDKVSNVLGDMYSEENISGESQAKLKELEQSEQQLFDETMELTQDDKEQVEENVVKLKEMLEARTMEIEEEENAMNRAKAFTAELNKIEEKLEESNRKEIERLKEAVTKRYDAHALFVKEYKALITAQKKMYDMLLEVVDVTILIKQVELINAHNEAVVKAIEEFNDGTESLNRIREEVYESIKNTK